MLNVIQSHAAFEYSHHVNCENGLVQWRRSSSFFISPRKIDDARKLMCFRFSTSEPRQHHIFYINPFI